MCPCLIRVSLTLFLNLESPIPVYKLVMLIFAIKLRVPLNFFVFFSCVFFFQNKRKFIFFIISNLHFLEFMLFMGLFPSYILIRILPSLSCNFLDKTLSPKIKDCQVVQTRMSREHGGRDHKTELQVGGVAEAQLYKVKTAEALNDSRLKKIEFQLVL